MNQMLRQQAFADAQSALPFVIGQGRNIETQIYERRYPAYNYAASIPVVTEGNPWAIGTTFFTVDTAGEAKFLSGAANDMPFNQATHDMASHDFAMIGSGWEWNIEEVNQAAMMGIPLNASKATSAADKVERLLNGVAMLGSTEKRWTGFLNDPNVTVVPSTVDFTDPATTVEEMLQAVNSLLSIIRTQTDEVEWADTLRLPPDAFRVASTRRLGEGDGFLTVLEFLRRNNIFTAETGAYLDILPLREARVAGVGGVGRMVAYRRDREVLRFHLPMPRTVLQTRHKSIMGFETGIIARTGGTEIRLPGAVAYMDGVTPAGAPILI